MTEPSSGAQNPQSYLAAERTFLAWIRTGLALMGFGFVVARFGLFLREAQRFIHAGSAQSSVFSLWSGTGLVLLGVVVLAVSVVRYRDNILHIAATTRRHAADGSLADGDGDGDLAGGVGPGDCRISAVLPLGAEWCFQEIFR